MKAVKWLIATKLLAVAGPILLVVVLGTGMLLVIVTAAVGSEPEALPGLCVSDGNLEQVLATIRHVESGGDYQAQSPASTASGAYQIVNGTWDGYGGYTRAGEPRRRFRTPKRPRWSVPRSTPITTSRWSLSSGTCRAPSTTRS